MTSITSTEQPYQISKDKATKIKVLYIVSAARSGSTLASVLLDQVDGFFSGAELISVWKGLKGKVAQPICGCGKHYRQCELWQAVFEAAYGGLVHVDIEAMWHQQQNVKSYLLDMFNPNRPQQRYQREDFKTYLEATESLYQAIYSVTTSRIIVDASKRLRYLYLLGTLPSLDLYVLHIVRDPRGVVYSQLFNPKVPRVPGGNVEAMGIAGMTAIRWARQNIEAQLLSQNRQTQWKYMRIRLEDLVAQPKTVLTDVIKFVEEDGNELISRFPFLSNQEVMLKDNHTFSGNRMRLHRGSLKLELDQAWHTKMRWQDKAIVRILTWPLLLQYKYPLI